MEVEVERRIQRIRDASANYRIVSTAPYTKIDFWNEFVDTVPIKRGILSDITKGVGIRDISIIFKLLTKVHRYDLVLLTGGERGDIIYLAIAGASPLDPNTTRNR